MVPAPQVRLPRAKQAIAAVTVEHPVSVVRRRFWSALSAGETGDHPVRRHLPERDEAVGSDTPVQR